MSYKKILSLAVLGLSLSVLSAPAQAGLFSSITSAVKSVSSVSKAVSNVSKVASNNPFASIGSVSSLKIPGVSLSSNPLSYTGTLGNLTSTISQYSNLTKGLSNLNLNTLSSSELSSLSAKTGISLPNLQSMNPNQISSLMSSSGSSLNTSGLSSFLGSGTGSSISSSFLGGGAGSGSDRATSKFADYLAFTSGISTRYKPAPEGTNITASAGGSGGFGGLSQFGGGLTGGLSGLTGSIKLPGGLGSISGSLGPGGIKVGGTAGIAGLGSISKGFSF